MPYRQNQLQPGLCPINPETGQRECPPATEKDCILVLKVFDQCVKDETIYEEVAIPLVQCPLLPATFNVECEVTAATCEVVHVSEPDEQNNVVVTVQQSVTIGITIIDPATGDTVCTFTHDIIRYNQVLLYGPAGTFAQCEVVAAICECDLIGDRLLLCRVRLCKEIEMKAFVKLLIPSYGYCVPGPCDQVLPDGDFVCPPPDRWPPQQQVEDP